VRDAHREVRHTRPLGQKSRVAAERQLGPAARRALHLDVVPRHRLVPGAQHLDGRLLGREAAREAVRVDAVG
jgi:autonomous glycyl radical cofactor GrcA